MTPQSGPIFSSPPPAVPYRLLFTLFQLSQLPSWTENGRRTYGLHSKSAEKYAFMIRNLLPEIFRMCTSQLAKIFVPTVPVLFHYSSFPWRDLPVALLLCITRFMDATPTETPTCIYYQTLVSSWPHLPPARNRLLLSPTPIQTYQLVIALTQKFASSGARPFPRGERPPS